MNFWIVLILLLLIWSISGAMWFRLTSNDLTNLKWYHKVLIAPYVLVALTIEILGG